MALVRLEIVHREAYEQGRAFGATGAYERIDAVAHYAVDPAHPANRDIVDLERAERAGDGLVHFQGDATFLLPVAPERGNRALLVEVPNRGNRVALRSFNQAPYDTQPSRRIHPGDGFLFERGWSVAWCGWQWDVPRPSLRMGLEAPQVPASHRAPDGQMQLRVQPDRACEYLALTDQHVGPVGDHRRIRAAGTGAADARLLVRDRLDEAPREIPREQWRFAQVEDGRVVADDGHVWLAGGFAPGRIYDVVYRPLECPVVGAGLLAVRDFAAGLRSDPDSPTAGRIEHVIGEGGSQCGRFLRTFLSLGLNADEHGRQVFDGVLAHIAGARRGEFNHRYGQPSVQPTPGFGHLFPFADDPQHDPHGGRVAGLLDRQRSRGCMPRIVYTDTASEYWRGDAALAHVTLDGQSDVVPPSHVRRYLFAGTQHGPGVLPFTEHSRFGSHAANRINVLDYRPLFRAALTNLLAWVAEDLGPPPSTVPELAAGTAAQRHAVLQQLHAIPGLALPDPDVLPRMRVLDLGPRAGDGIGAFPAPAGGAPYPALVSAVDGDGNEIGGIRMPDLCVPVATHTGFNPRHPASGGPGQILEYLGSTAPFAGTAAARHRSGDPRPALDERYRDRDAYLAQVRAAAGALAAARWLLHGDIELCVALAGERYDACRDASA